MTANILRDWDKNWKTKTQENFDKMENLKKDYEEKFKNLEDEYDSKLKSQIQ